MKSQTIVLGLAALVAMSFACSSDSKTPLAPTSPPTGSIAQGPGGSTLKASAPTPQSPINDQRLETFTAATLRATTSELSFASGTTVQYRFQVFNENNALVQDSGVVGEPTWTMTAELEFDKRYTWRVRTEYQDGSGEWSALASFVAPNGGFKRGNQVFDPLTNSQSVGVVNGGTFLPGKGWQARSVIDFINYDIPTTTAATFEFDISNVSSDEPGPYNIGMKFYCMGDGAQWDFIGFRNQAWKASLDKKSGRLFPGESGVVEHIFRLFGDDNRTKTGTRKWHEEQTYHVRLVWGNGRVRLTIDDEVIADESYGGSYAPPNHRVSLGCAARGETLQTAIWSNVKITPQ